MHVHCKGADVSTLDIVFDTQDNRNQAPRNPKQIEPKTTMANKLLTTRKHMCLGAATELANPTELESPEAKGQTLKPVFSPAWEVMREKGSSRAENVLKHALQSSPAPTTWCVYCLICGSASAVFAYPPSSSAKRTRFRTGTMCV